MMMDERTGGSQMEQCWKGKRIIRVGRPYCQFQLRLPPDLFQGLHQLANKNKNSINRELVLMIKEKIEKNNSRDEF